MYTQYILGSFVEISPEGDISTKYPKTAVYIVYTPNNHYIYDKYYDYIFRQYRSFTLLTHFLIIIFIGSVSAHAPNHHLHAPSLPH